MATKMAASHTCFKLNCMIAKLFKVWKYIFPISANTLSLVEARIVKKMWTILTTCTAL